jgi:hypothetical protein
VKEKRSAAERLLSGFWFGRRAAQVKANPVGPDEFSI